MLVGVACQRPGATVAPTVADRPDDTKADTKPSAPPIELSLSDSYACVRQGDGVTCWGDDVVLPLGYTASPKGLMTMPAVGIRDYAAGPDRFCVIIDKGLQCWGHDPDMDSLSLGDDATIPIETLDVPIDPVEVRIDDSTVCAKDRQDGLTCWTYEEPEDDYDEMYEDETPWMEHRDLPDPVLDFDPGEDFVCAITPERDVLCWGSDPGHIDVIDREWSECIEGEDMDGYYDDCEEEEEDCEAAEYEDEMDLEAECDLAQEEALDLAWSLDDAIEVEGIPKPRRIQAGTDFVCVLADDGRVFCWGEGGAGQLGNGAYESSLTPVPVLGIDDAEVLAVADSHACVVRRDGTVACWGDNESSVVGGSNGKEAVPRPVEGITDAVDVEVVSDLSCAVVREGPPRCWGRDDHERVRDRAAPTQWPKVPLKDVAHLMPLGQEDSCAALEDGSVWCWGRHELPRFLHVETYASPRRRPLDGVVELFPLGPCARTAKGDLRCWRDGTEMREGGATVRRASDVVAADAGRYHLCVVTSKGEVQCWRHEPSKIPTVVPVTSVGAAVDVAVGRDRACAARRDGGIDCWSLGARSSLPPQRLKGAVDVGGIVSFSDQVCASSGSGTIQCWKWDRLDDAPFELPLPGVESLAAGSSHACALAKGEVWCWGGNRVGQLGRDGRRSAALVHVPQLHDVVEIAAGDEHTCARDRGGMVRCWGRDREGQLGVLPEDFLLEPRPMFRPGWLDEDPTTVEAERAKP